MGPLKVQRRLSFCVATVLVRQSLLENCEFHQWSLPEVGTLWHRPLVAIAVIAVIGNIADGTILDQQITRWSTTWQKSDRLWWTSEENVTVKWKGSAWKWWKCGGKVDEHHMRVMKNVTELRRARDEKLEMQHKTVMKMRHRWPTNSDPAQTNCDENVMKKWKYSAQLWTTNHSVMKQLANAWWKHNAANYGQEVRQLMQTSVEKWPAYNVKINNWRNDKHKQIMR